MDVKNQNLFKNACILQSEEIEYSVNIKVMIRKVHDAKMQRAIGCWKDCDTA